MKTKRIAFDLDGVIGTLVEGTTEPEDRYAKSKPAVNMIKIVNELYDQGNYIIIYTARGMSTYKGDATLAYNSLFELTKNQLQSWGVKHHQLVMGKIHYDVLIDDKAINSLRVTEYKDIQKFVNIK